MKYALVIVLALCSSSLMAGECVGGTCGVRSRVVNVTREVVSVPVEVTRKTVEVTRLGLRRLGNRVRCVGSNCR